ncbi:MAG TPA: phosphoglycerate kinase [Solirubrobacteraceae bacterium]|nr:phosphoglycerate kinase [Solirubrobacteraceae bacterium]
MKSLDEIDVDGRRVFVRVDFNVPLKDGVITDDTRIRAALPTIENLRGRGARVILASHLGRPKDGPDPAFSLAPVAVRLSELAGVNVDFAQDVVGPSAHAAVDRLQPGGLLLLENVRFEPGETKNDERFAAALGELADVYVDDAFGSAHRAHASTEGITHHVAEVAAGLLLEREVTALNAILADPRRPLVAVLGGAKVTDKIAVIRRFLELADTVLIGGAMCFPFLKVQGHAIGASMCEEAGLQPAREALALAGSSHAKLRLPVDLGLGESLEGTAARRDADGVEVPDGWMGLDIGPRTAAAYAQEIAAAGTVFWNGPMGVFELDAFAAGTRAVAEAVAAAPGTTVVGGGDSVAALTKLGLQASVSHLSTGGGATLELIEGRTLPGVEALERAGGNR